MLGKLQKPLYKKNTLQINMKKLFKTLQTNRINNINAEKK